MPCAVFSACYNKIIMTEEDKKFAEKRRLFLEECYQEDDPTAVVVTVFGDVDYETNHVILDYQAKGYRFDCKSLKTKVKFPCIIHWNFNFSVKVNFISFPIFVIPS